MSKPFIQHARTLTLRVLSYMHASVPQVSSHLLFHLRIIELTCMHREHRHRHVWESHAGARDEGSAHVVFRVCARQPAASPYPSYCASAKVEELRLWQTRFECFSCSQLDHHGDDAQILASSIHGHQVPNTTGEMPHIQEAEEADVTPQTALPSPRRLVSSDLGSSEKSKDQRRHHMYLCKRLFEVRRGLVSSASRRSDGNLFSCSLISV